MNHAVSLMPMPRMLASRCRKRRVLWILINAGAVAIGGTATLAARSILLGDEYLSASSAAAAQSRLDSILAEHEAQTAELRSIETKLQAHAEATQHPDWSVLLGYISRIGASSVVLEMFSLVPGEAIGTYTVTLTGQAVSQNAVTEFLLGLERSGVFSETSLRASSRATTGGFSFEIMCTIGGETP